MSQEKENVNLEDILHKFGNFMDEEIRGVKLGCYSVALIGLTVAIRRVRPFSRFQRPSDIPNRFLSERKELIGTVERVEPAGALLMVRHQPLIPLPKTSQTQLPVKVSGIEISGNGISWLQTIVVGNKIKFIPVLKETNWVQCEVQMKQQLKKDQVREINIGESLVSVGFANLNNLHKPLSTNVSYNQYYRRLKAAEVVALRKKLGYAYYRIPIQAALFKLLQALIWLTKKAQSAAVRKLKAPQVKKQIAQT